MTTTSTPVTPDVRPRDRSIGSRLVVALGFLAHGVVGVFVLASGLMMPLWAIVALAAFRSVALVAAIRRRDHPLFVLLTPVVTFAVWYLAGWAGETYLGWTA
jgi:hypothetical protein